MKAAVLREHNTPLSIEGKLGVACPCVMGHEPAGIVLVQVLIAAAYGTRMLKGTFENVRDNLHISVSVGSEALAGSDGIVIDDAERKESHMIRVIVVRKRKRVITIQPAVISVAPLIRSSDFNHRVSGYRNFRLWLES